MAKKRKKTSRKAKRYSKTQFVDIVCHHCQLCEVDNPFFCYKKMYRKNPETFMNECYTRLMNLRLWVKTSDIDSITTAIFREMFCYSGVCGGTRLACEDTLACYELFKSQLKGVNVLEIPEKKGRKRRRLTDDPYIFEAYPTFFLSDNEEWRNEVEGILKDED